MIRAIDQILAPQATKNSISVTLISRLMPSSIYLLLSFFSKMKLRTEICKYVYFAALFRRNLPRLPIMLLRAWDLPNRMRKDTLAKQAIEKQAPEPGCSKPALKVNRSIKFSCLQWFSPFLFCLVRDYSNSKLKDWQNNQKSTPKSAKPETKIGSYPGLA